MRLGFIATICLIFAFLISSCSPVDRITTTLATNIPESAIFVELYNAQSEVYKLELKYWEKPEDSLTDNIHPDIILGEYVNAAAIRHNLHDLNDLIEKQIIAPDIFYSSLYRMGIHDGVLRSVPLSFSLPVVLFSSKNLNNQLDAFYLDLETMKELSSAFTKKNNLRLTNIGFSPVWFPELYVLTARLQGLDFFEAPDRSIRWKNPLLSQNLAFLRELIFETSETVTNAMAFQQRYLYEPQAKLLEKGRILFSLATPSEYERMGNKDQFSFRWLSLDEKVPATSPFLSVALPIKGENIYGAKDFLLWLLREETQQKILESTRRKSRGAFGIYNGFSSIIDVNERLFPQYYEYLVGNIPDKESLVFPSKNSRKMTAFFDELYIPWVEEELKNPGGGIPLDTATNQWARQYSE